MTDQPVHDSLRTLQAELQKSKAQASDAQAPHLDALHERVQTALANDPTRHEGLRDALKSAIIRFESSHPSIAAAAEDVIDTLSNLGI